MYAWQSTAQSGGTRSRKKEAAPPPESSVQAFVKEKAAERKLRMDVSRALGRVIRSLTAPNCAAWSSRSGAAQYQSTGRRTSC